MHEQSKVRMTAAVTEKSKVRMTAVVTEGFEIGVGAHQGSALNPLLFVTVMEEVTKEARGGGPWEVLYADD